MFKQLIGMKELKNNPVTLDDATVCVITGPDPGRSGKNKNPGQPKYPDLQVSIQSYFVRNNFVNKTFFSFLRFLQSAT